jgi:hypothetical protein
MKKAGVVLSGVLIVLMAVIFVQCSLIQTFVNLTRVKFKLQGVENIYVANVSVMNKTRLSDFSPVEILQLSASVLKGSLPVSFILNINAVNPNKATAKSSASSATITSFPWRLVVDSKEVLSGNIAHPVTIPGNGQQADIPLAISFDLMRTFKDKSYEGLINIVLRTTGKSTGSASFELYASPVVHTEIGNISYPGEIKIISKTWTD